MQTARPLPDSANRLRESKTDEGLYRLMVEAVHDYAIYMLNKDGIVSSWNPGARRFKGYEEAEIVGHHFSKFYTPEDRESGLPERALATAAEQGKFEGEGWRVRKDGTRFWAHAVIDPVRAPDGTLVGYAKIIRDLTERRAAEAVLKRSEEQFRLLVQSVTDYAIYMLDENGNISNWNAGAQRIKGYRPEEIIGQNFSRFYTEEDRAAGLPQYALETAAREGRFEKEGIRVRKDGTTFAAHVVIDAIRDQSGALIGFAKVTRDISERRNAQRELDKAREALFQSQKMDAVGQLTGGVAHDFNNLLMAILGSLELLRKRLPAEPQMLRLLDNAMQGAQRGAVLTQRMLSFARRQALEPKAIDLPQLVRNMVELLQSSVGAGISIETRFPLALSEVLADVNQLELALLNLVVNARDAMPGGGTVEIAAAEENIGAGHATGLSPGRYVCLSVKDHGEGMDDEVLTRAADPFFTTKGVGKGTGLGLSMVQGMAAQIGGRFMLKSGKGEGTTATIWIPVAQEEAGTEKQPAATAQEQTTMCALTVLAVDDDHLVLFNTVAMLEDLGHTAFEAHSGAAALQILESRKIDLVITDQAMPQMSGLQLAEMVKDRWPDVPVVLATGYAELPPGADKSLLRIGKPFSEADLAAAIAKQFCG